MTDVAEILSRDDAERMVRKAARGLAGAGLVGAYGHCSVRLSKTELLVCAPRPMGNIAPGEAGTVVPIAGPLPPQVLGEVRVHQQIYQARPDIGAVCRVFPPHVMTMSILGRAPECRHGLGAFFAPRPAYWDSVALMRSDEIARKVALRLSESPGVILRGNGAVVAASDMRKAATLCWFLEDMCRIELAVLSVTASVSATSLSEAEMHSRNDWSGRAAQRMWDHLTRNDPE